MALVRDFRQLFVEGLFSDVKVAVTTPAGGTTKEEILHLHRNVLACRSKYFRNRLTGGYSDGAAEILNLEIAPGSSIAATKALLEYLYTNIIEITEDSVMEILSGANNLLLTSVKEDCSAFLEENLTAGTVCTVLSACHHIMGLEPLKLRAMIFLYTHAKAALEDEQVVELPKEVFVELLAGDDLGVDEEVIFKALVRWGEHTKDANSTVGDALRDMIPLLRLEAMEMEFLKNTVRPSGLVTDKRLADALFDLPESEMKGRKRDRDSAQGENSLHSEDVHPKKRRRTGGRSILIAGQEAGDAQHYMMGAYVLMEGKVVSGRCVWKREGMGMETIMYYAAGYGGWFVGSINEDMEAGRPNGVLRVASDAMTPDAATEQWRVCNGEEWQNVPKTTTCICTEDERQAMVRQAEEEAVAKEEVAVAKAQEACIIVLAGHEAGELQHSLMGAYVLMEGKVVSGRCVWKREGKGMEAYMYYAASDGEWNVGRHKTEMEAGRDSGVLTVVSDAMTPDAATEEWKAWDGDDDCQNAPKITTRICTEHERQAMVRQAEEEAVAKAKEARIIVLAGQEAGEVQHRMMGAYVLMEGKVVSGRCVWKREGMGMEAYMYYAARRGQWHVGTHKKDMEAGRAKGVLGVASVASDASDASDAMTPDAATEKWKVHTGDKWQNAPKITTRICTEHERQAMVRQAEEEAVAKAQEARIIVLAGQEAGEVQHSMMGAYVLMEGKVVSGRCVWKREGMGMEAYMYYAASDGEWNVSSINEDMEAGHARGYLSVVSDAMSPDAATEEWKAWDGDGEEWHAAPKITTRICTEHERQAMVRQAEEEAVTVAIEAAAKAKEAAAGR
jgi:hypothetical protein